MLKRGVLDNKKYFEVGSCSTLGDAQARRLGIRMKTDKGNMFLNTLNNTVIASPRSLIAILECNYQSDGSVKIPKVLQPYMGNLEVIRPKKNNYEYVRILFLNRRN